MSVTLTDSVRALREEALAEAQAAPDLGAVEAARLKYLGRKGALTAVLRGLKDLSPEERGRVGAEANALRDALEAALEARREALEGAGGAAAGGVDVTLPGRRPWVGHYHVLNQVRDELVDVFYGLGFGEAEGTEVEDDRHNFEMLNLPPGHPAREAHDTYYLENGLVMRTHTSPGWVRAMEASPPPLRLVFPGRVFRAESIDATHMDQFHQMDGLYVAERVTLADLRSTLREAARRLFGEKTRVRFVPLYFPFTEPSAQMDVSCLICGGSGALASGARCPVCKATGWLEILGSGMVHPAVFRAVGYDPDKVSGWAFGMGLERIAMLRHGLDDIRHFLENDLRFSRQF
ncbi:MAG TPA: phenylalanine--tRNA ligase subunit alpha [Candidatus Eisenbacteria bacterium]|nr:phenylalanine--tRNA ligase subunit alpha [Candidatus Eisenbacteria bacterium]